MLNFVQYSFEYFRLFLYPPRCTDRLRSLNSPYVMNIGRTLEGGNAYGN